MTSLTWKTMEAIGERHVLCTPQNTAGNWPSRADENTSLPISRPTDVYNCTSITHPHMYNLSTAKPSTWTTHTHWRGQFQRLRWQQAVEWPPAQPHPWQPHQMAAEKMCIPDMIRAYSMQINGPHCSTSEIQNKSFSRTCSYFNTWSRYHTSSFIEALPWNPKVEWYFPCVIHCLTSATAWALSISW